MKTIKIEITENDVQNLTSVLIDVLDYYSTLSDKQEKMKMLAKATELSNRLNKSYYDTK